MTTMPLLPIADRFTSSESTESIPEALNFPKQLWGELQNGKRKLRVEILECSGGEGHKQSASAIENALKNHFDREGIALAIEKLDVGSHLAPDPLGKVTLGKYKMIDLHNYLARHGYTRLIALMTKIGKFVYRFHFGRNVAYFNKRYNKLKSKGETPDIVISATPLVNGPLLQAVKARNIPVMVATTDADNALFSLNWPTSDDLAPYRYGIPYNSMEIVQRVNKAVDPSCIRGIGYPVRGEFLKSYTQKEVNAFRKELGITQGKKVIGVMMGGLGGVVTENYMASIFRANRSGTLVLKDSEFVVFCGRNEKLQLTLIENAKNVGFKIQEGAPGEGTQLIDPATGCSIRVLGFTSNVYKYMALSNCFVTKPGSSTFNECLCMGLPMLLDNTSRPLPWEALNYDLAETYCFGERVSSFDRFIPQLNSILEESKNKKYHEAMVAYRDGRPVQKEFEKNVVKLTYELLHEAEQNAADRLKIKSQERKNTQQSSFFSVKALRESVVTISKSVARVAKKVYDFVIASFIFPVRWLTQHLVDYAFFSGFNIKNAVKIKRRRELIQGIRTDKSGKKTESPHKAIPIEGLDLPLVSPVTNRPIDALYLKSASEKRTGNAVLFIQGKHYQNFHPKNYDHLLDDGADIVLFNPTALNAKTMAADLQALIKELIIRNPNQKIALHGHCIGAHVAASVAADIAAGKVEGLANKSFPVIVDRGYGDGNEVAEKVTIFAKFPLAKRYINRYYNNQTLKKIHQHTGDMLFLSPPDGDDCMVHQKRGRKVRNMTKELHDNHSKEHNTWIELEKGADHWTPWTYKIHNKVKKFLSDQGMIASYKEYTEDDTGGFPKRTSVPWARRRLLPLFV